MLNQPLWSWTPFSSVPGYADLEAKHKSLFVPYPYAWGGDAFGSSILCKSALDHPDCCMPLLPLSCICVAMFSIHFSFVLCVGICFLQADIYSFGLFLFELVTAGKRPFEELDFPVELDNRYLEEAPIPQLTECDCQPWPDMQDMIAQVRASLLYM